MKTANMKEKLTAALAARSGVLPRNGREAVSLCSECTGIDSDRMSTTYEYFTECYVATLCGDIRSNRRARRTYSRFLTAFFLSKRTGDLAEVAQHVRNLVGRNRNPRPIEPLPLSTMARARARPLTPKGRKYRTAVGIEIEGFAAMPRESLEARLPCWGKVVRDGSIDAPQDMNQAEVVLLLNRDEMEPRLFTACDRLNKLNFRTNKSCGLHVHLDARHLPFGEVCSKAKIMDKWLFALRELVPPSRRENTYCKFGFSSSDRYRAVNVTSYSKHSTLEVRLHSSSTSYQKVLAWVRLVELLFAFKKAPKAGLGGCMAVLDTLPLADYERAYWRARHAQINPALYQGAAIASNGGEE